MTTTSIISYLLDRKNILSTIIFCLIGLIVLLVGMFTCDAGLWNYLFVWIIPGSGVVTLGIYAVSMTEKHPVILVFPSIMIFSGLFIRYLLSFEYHIVLFLLLQSIPYLLFCCQAKTMRFRPIVHTSLVYGFCSCFCFLLALLFSYGLDRINIICIPHNRLIQYEILTYIEIMMSFHYLALDCLSRELQLIHVENETGIHSK